MSCSKFDYTPGNDDNSEVTTREFRGHASLIEANHVSDAWSLNFYCTQSETNFVMEKHEKTRVIKYQEKYIDRYFHSWQNILIPNIAGLLPIFKIIQLGTQHNWNKIFSVHKVLEL